jgi:hypothetical protein
MEGWVDQDAVKSFETGDELSADKSAPEIPTYATQKAGSSNH